MPLSETTVPNCRLANTLTHGAGRQLAGRGGNDVFTPIRSKPTESVEKGEVEAGGGRDRHGFGAMGTGRDQDRGGCFRHIAAFDLFRQRTSFVGNNGAGDGLNQDTVLFRYLISRPYKDTTGAINDVGFDTLRQSTP